MTQPLIVIFDQDVPERNVSVLFNEGPYDHYDVAFVAAGYILWINFVFIENFY
jgi:hypothetical protein